MISNVAPTLFFLLSCLQIFSQTAQAQRSWTSAPFDPPAIPLFGRSPFSAAWLPNGNGTELFNDWSRNWNDGTEAWAGFVRVDGTTYRTMGWHLDAAAAPAKQLSMRFTATSTVFTLQCGPVDVTYTFVSPTDPSDLVRFSLPFAYLLVTAASNDGTSHNISIYADITAEWVNDKTGTQVQWKTRLTSPEPNTQNGLITHQVWQTTPVNCTQTANNRIQDGTIQFSAFNSTELSYATGESASVRRGWLSSGKLDNVLDANYRAVDSSLPVFAFSHNVGTVLGTSPPVVFGIGQSRENIVQYITAQSQAQYRAPFYLTKFATSEAALDFFMRDHERAVGVADAMDRQVDAEATAISANYSGLVQLAFRQAAAGFELTAARKADGTIDATDIMMFQAEYGGKDHYRVNNIEQIYMTLPYLLYLNPTLVKHVLRPTLQYHKAGLSNTAFCSQNIGARYPQAMGTDGKIELPIAASASMLIMVAAHLQRTQDKALVTDYYEVLKGFADYLVDETLHPKKQFSITETFMIPDVANQTNLAVQGIIALRAMSDIAAAQGDTEGQATYSDKATSYISQWENLTMTANGEHLAFQYGQDESYVVVHNLFPDRLLGYNLVSKDVYATQESWYEKVRRKFGPQLFWQTGWQMSGPNMWIAATMEKATMRDHIVGGILEQLQSGVADYPMPDRFDANMIKTYEFRGRPSVGSHFSLLAMQGKSIDFAAFPNVDTSDELQHTTDTGFRILPSIFNLSLLASFVGAITFLL